MKQEAKNQVESDVAACNHSIVSLGVIKAKESRHKVRNLGLALQITAHQ